VKMKYLDQKGFSPILMVLLVGLVFASSMALTKVMKDNSNPSATAGSGGKGNGAPSGPHFNLNIIGVPKAKTTDMTGGGRIFVPLQGKCQINLTESADTSMYVTDANCTDGKGGFQLPNPDPENDGITEYSVWVRARGKPGGSSSTTACGELYDEVTMTTSTYCSVYKTVAVRDKGKGNFADVSRELLYVYVDLTGPEGVPDGVPERYNLFSDALQNYFWDYDNNGLKLLQMRFYQVPSVVE